MGVHVDTTIVSRDVCRRIVACTSGRNTAPLPVDVSNRHCPSVPPSILSSILPSITVNYVGYSLANLLHLNPCVDSDQRTHSFKERKSPSVLSFLSLFCSCAAVRREYFTALLEYRSYIRIPYTNTVPSDQTDRKKKEKERAVYGLFLL